MLAKNIGKYFTGFFDPMDEDPYEFYKRKVKPAKERGEVPSHIHFWYPIRNREGKRTGLGRF